MDRNDPAKEPRRWSGPIETLGEDERRSLVHSMTAAAQPRIEIDQALSEGWFEVWYQPKIDLKRKCLAGAEALARIRHPQLGVLLPGSFLPGAGENSIARLTEHALVVTLQNWSLFDDAGFNLHLAINVPVSALLDMPIAELIATHRPASDRWPGVIVEITEDQVVRDIKLTQAIAARLRVSGVQISIDDFGAGYSSMSSLRELPFVELKLDHSFVRDCAADGTNAAICQTAIDLAHRFGGAVVAEGLENVADLEALVAMGCDFGQGVLIAPPMPQERFLALLMQRASKVRAQANEAVTAAPPMGRVA